MYMKMNTIDVRLLICYCTVDKKTESLGITAKTLKKKKKEKNQVKQVTNRQYQGSFDRSKSWMLAVRVGKASKATDH